MTSTYVSNDLTFGVAALRADVEDRTVHELVVAGKESSLDLLLAVSRQALPAGHDLLRAVSALHDGERRSLGAYTIVSSEERAIGGLSWIDTRITWKHPTGPVYHRRLHTLVGATWMSVTATSKRGNAEWADRVAEHVTATFRPRPKED